MLGTGEWNVKYGDLLIDDELSRGRIWNSSIYMYGFGDMSFATEEDEKLGARPDLSRTYMEVGKRLQEQKTKYKHLNGITADEYLDKAEKLFQEMDLQ